MSQSNTSPFPNAYAAFEAELAKILEHKYLESQKSGHDIGFERALKDWAANHRPNWREEMRAKTR
ncbi:MAG: hypothetical protein JNM99_03190 [Verrucomicrobiaceae bacterium]|nr:hypothetical protein [Verrucomicrobiaceae bacterium]